MKVVIIDNEINALNYLVNILKDNEDITIEKTFEDSVEALIYLIKNPCDILFLDIEMPNINGIYLAEQIINLHAKIKICFVTAFNDFAVKAFELNAIDYILKPYSKGRVEECLNKIRSSKTKEYNISSLSNECKYELDIICGFKDDDVVLLSYGDIFYFDILNRKVLIHTKNNVYEGNKTLNFYEEKLKKHSFFRTHKCYIVNLTKIAKFTSKINYNYDMYFKAIDDIVPLSRSKVKELKLYIGV